MSFILDALKKSENERKRAIGPSLVDAPLRRQHPDRPWWALAVGALLVVNLGVLLVVLNRKEEAPQATSATTAAAPVTTVASNAPANPLPMNAQRAAPSDPSVRSLADEAAGYGEDEYRDAPPPESYEPPPANPDLAAAAAVPQGPPIVQPIDAPAVAPLSARQRAAINASAPPAASNAPKENLPTLTALVASGSQLPELRLDIHVYSDTPADRFAFVNMRKYTEGQTLSEGPTLERITREGVVLNSQGQRFLLPRQ